MNIQKLGSSFYVLDNVRKIRIYQETEPYKEDPGFSDKMCAPDFKWKLVLVYTNGDIDTIVLDSEDEAKQIEERFKNP